MKKLQHAKSARGEKCKTKTLQRVKVQHEIVPSIKRMKKSATCKDFYIKKCNMQMMEYEKSAT